MSRLATIVRQAVPADLPSLAALLESAGSDNPLGAPLGLPTTGVLLERLRAFTENHPGHITVATIENVLVGTAIAMLQPPGLFADGPWIQVEVLYVRPDVRRHGVGRALLADQVAYAIEVDAESIVTLPTTGSRNEQRFLSRLGFSAAGARRTCETAVLHRRLDEGPRGGLEALIARRRAMTGGTPPRGIALPAYEGDGDDGALLSRRQVRRAELMRRSSSSVTSTR